LRPAAPATIPGLAAYAEDWRAAVEAIERD
jgi:hypothetical protein